MAMVDSDFRDSGHIDRASRGPTIARCFTSTPSVVSAIADETIVERDPP
jgi:hypothetical protein